MTPRQKTALTHPCARSVDILDPRFKAVVTSQGSVWSTILSVNK